MKFSSTIPLALALVGGVAVAAAAQTASSSAGGPTVPQTIAPTTPAGSSLGQQGDNMTAPAGRASATEAQTAPNGQIKATQTTRKRTAHLKSAPRTLKRMAAHRTEHARHARMAQLRPASEPVPTPTTDQIKSAQEQLHAAGLYSGPTDGLMDPDTRAAIARYQQQNGLRRTDTLDRQTLARLNSNQTTGYGSSTPSTTPAPTGAGGDTVTSPPTK